MVKNIDILNSNEIIMNYILKKLKYKKIFTFFRAISISELCRTF